jgi:propanediol utilization protein
MSIKSGPPRRLDKGLSLEAPVVVSASHAHLTPATIEALFCDHYRLHAFHPLGQPSVYEADETVTLIGPGGHLNHVPIVGPPRSENQIEVSATDAQVLGLAVPLRRSGQLAGTPGLAIQGPRTRVRLESGLIRTLRHVHMNPAQAEMIGACDGDYIDACTRTQPPIVLRGILARVLPDSRLELHLDMDEARALDLQSGDLIELRASSASPHPGDVRHG